MALRFGSNNRLGQRLMAAGASPERAQQFVEQVEFNKGPQLPEFGGGQRLMALGDPFDDQSRAASESFPEFQNVFRPPSASDSSFKDYVDVVLGRGAYNSLTAKYTKGAAPLWEASKRSNSMLDKAIVQAITEKNASIAEITESLLNATSVGLLGGRTPQQAVDYAEKVFADYTKLQNFDVNEKLVQELNKNKAYEFGLPDQKLRYGLTTDLKKGTISIMTHPQVAKVYRQVAPMLKGDPAAEAKFNSWITGVLADANAQKRTPYLDEVRRREKFRGKKVGG